MLPKRISRAAELIKRQISGIIQHNLQDPGLGFITITKVVVTKDMREADIWVSIMGDREAKDTSMNALARARGHIRELLADRITMRFTPQLRFHLDTSQEYSARISEVIQRLRREEGWENE